MKVLTETQLLEQTLNTGGKREVTYNLDGFDRVENVQHSFVQTSIKEVKLNSELYLKITRANCSQAINCQVDHDNFDFLVSKFYLSGHHGVICPQIPGIAETYQETKGKNYLFYLPNIQEVEQYFTDEPLYTIVIEIRPKFIFNFCNSLDLIPLRIKCCTDEDKISCFHLPVGKLTSEMQIVLQQIVTAPYQGMLQKMYWESKILELLVLQLSQLLNKKYQRKIIALKQLEIDKIYQAKEILINNLVEPPTLMSLAQQVGIHHMKLKQGFKELFATTPFAYLREYRLEVARNLLLENRSSVISVASNVGYSNASHFAAAFKRKYGVSPKNCKFGK